MLIIIVITVLGIIIFTPINNISVIITTAIIIVKIIITTFYLYYYGYIYKCYFLVTIINIVIIIDEPTNIFPLKIKINKLHYFLKFSTNRIFLFNKCYEYYYIYEHRLLRSFYEEEH